MKDDPEEVATLLGDVNHRGPSRGDTSGNANPAHRNGNVPTKTSTGKETRIYVVLATTFLVMALMGKYYTGIFAVTNENLEGRAHDGSNETSSQTTSTSKKLKKPTKVATPPPTFAPPEFPVPNRNDDLPKGFKKPASQVSDTYLRRGKDLTEEQQKALAEQWGSWTLVDSKPRPSWDDWRTLMNAYPNGDAPLNPATSVSNANGTASSDNSTTTKRTTTKVTFDATALPWQLDTEYLSEWLPQSIALVERAMEAILGEYGHSKFDQPGKSFEERAWMFSLNNPADGFNRKRPPSNGGFASPATLEAIEKRLLHAIVTQSSFLLAMGGHSAAAGHGNHFAQSYTLQVQRVLEPLLARLGVYHVSHNFGMGGMGTVQNAMASADLYGPDLDLLLWDCGMTEGEDSVKDLFARVALLTGRKVPVIWGEPDYGRYEGAAPGAGHIHTIYYGVGFGGVEYLDDPVKAGQGPYATRYINCGGAANQVCADNRYRTTCWTSFGGIEPPAKQTWTPHGAASWHPGHNYQRLTGRVIAFVILQQLLNGLKKWLNAPDHILPDEAWHLTADYTRVRQAVAAMKDTPCKDLPLSNKVCEVKFRAKSEFTPRYNPVETSIRSIIKEGVFVPPNSPNVYDPPEPHLDVLDPPDGEVDVISVIENGVDYVPNMARREVLTGYRRPGRFLQEDSTSGANATKPDSTAAGPKRKPITSNLEPGQGWSLNSKSASDNCDGTIDSFCGRSNDNDCLFNGHNDNRGGLGFDSLSGWMIVNLADVKHGVIIVRIEDWWGPGVVWRTQNWKCENGKTDCAAAATPPAKKRALGQNPNRCDHYNFEFAIDGKITSWDKAAFEENRKTVQRVASMWQLLNDPQYTGGESKDVELAIRLTGCGRETSFGLSHIYWA